MGWMEAVRDRVAVQEGTGGVLMMGSTDREEGRGTVMAMTMGMCPPVIMKVMMPGRRCSRACTAWGPSGRLMMTQPGRGVGEICVKGVLSR